MTTTGIDRDAPRRFVERLRGLTPEQWQALARSLDHLRGDDIAAVWRRARHKTLLVAMVPGLHTIGALGFAAADLVGEFSPPAEPPDFEALRRVARASQHDAPTGIAPAPSRMLWSIDIHETCERALPGDELVAYTALRAGTLLEFPESWLPNHVALYAPIEPFIPAATV